MISKGMGYVGITVRYHNTLYRDGLINLYKTNIYVTTMLLHLNEQILICGANS